VIRAIGWVLAWVVAGTAWAADAPSTRPATRPADFVELPSFGVSFPCPAGLKRHTDNSVTLAQFITAGWDKRGTPEQIMMIDIMGPAKQSLVEMAAKSAQADAATAVIRNRAAWGDKVAAEVTVGAKPGARDHVQVRHLLVEHEGYVYRLRYSVAPSKVDDLRAYDEIVRGTVWTKLVRPGQGLRVRLPMLSIQNGMYVIVPDPFRPIMDETDKRTNSYFARDLIDNNVAAKLLEVPLPVPPAGLPRRSVAGAKAEFTEQLVPSMGLKDPLRWVDDPDGRFSLTPVLRREHGWMRALVTVPDGDTATVYVLESRPDADAARTDGIELTLEAIQISVDEGRKFKEARRRP
jgi:hypothetical protein